jgi:hypothetical protein
MDRLRGRRAIEQAVDLARAQNSALMLMSVAPPVSTYVTLGGVRSEAMAAELERWADRTLAEAAASLPEDVNGDTLRRSATLARRSWGELLTLVPGRARRRFARASFLRLVC